MIHLAIDPGEAFGPVVTVAREQPYALALALDDQAKERTAICRLGLGQQ